MTEVGITQQMKTTCGDDVTGRDRDDGAAGTVSYEWAFQPQTRAPQPQSQTVTAGRTHVFVTAAVEGQGQGTRRRRVTLRVLGPDPGTLGGSR